MSSSQPAAAYETSDHTLKLASERAALENRGGSSRGGRVLADQWAVAVPRALGGAVWRAAGISPAPDVATLSCGGADGLVLASDGLWDVLSSDDAAAFVRANRLFRPERSAAQVAAALASRAAALATDDVVRVFRSVSNVFRSLSFVVNARAALRVPRTPRSPRTTPRPLDARANRLFRPQP